MSRDRSDDSGRHAIDEPAGDETVIGGPRARRKPKFIESSSGLQTVIFENERPATVPEGTDEISLGQPDVTDTEVQTGMTLDPSQRARVLDVHNKADRLLAELDATANIKIPKKPVNPIARTEPAGIDEEPAMTLDELDDDSIEEGETIVDPRAIRKPRYPTPLPVIPTHTPSPGTIPGTGAAVAHTPIPGAVSSQSLEIERDDDADLMTLETGWSPHPPVAPRPMMTPPPRRTVGSVLLAPFRAIAALFRPSGPRSDGPDLDESSNLQTYTQVNRMVQRRRQHSTSSPPPRDGSGDKQG